LTNNRRNLGRNRATIKNRLRCGQDTVAVVSQHQIKSVVLDVSDDRQRREFMIIDMTPLLRHDFPRDQSQGRVRGARLGCSDRRAPNGAAADIRYYGDSAQNIASSGSANPRQRISPNPVRLRPAGFGLTAFVRFAGSSWHGLAQPELAKRHSSIRP